MTKTKSSDFALLSMGSLIFYNPFLNASSNAHSSRPVDDVTANLPYATLKKIGVADLVGKYNN